MTASSPRQTSLPPDDERRRLALAHDAIGRYPLRGEPELRFVRQGENTTLEVRAEGRRFALRMHRPGYQTAASVASELAWTESLQSVGIRTPAAVPGRDGRPVQRLAAPEGERLTVLFEWVEGTPLRAEDDAALWRRLGTEMALIHEHGRRWRPPDWFTRRAWDAAGMVGPEPHWGDPLALHEWPPAERAVLESARAAVRERLAAFGRGPDRYGLIHADLGFENILARPDGGTVLLDFDDGGPGWFLYDLAVSLFPLERQDPDQARRAREAMLAGYREVAPLPEAHLAELPTFSMARRLVTLGWVFTRPETDHAARQRPWRIRSAVPAAREFLAWAERHPPAIAAEPA